ncbi:hypothetical protein GCM10016455_04940 [Aliiroseovarius zhejiangensis]|uniref:Uncharacterized protein n=1 Tax=Aliiroseovarius zhejiangensis TaxID=1632025 RepID=A0ABQ3IMG4_9RHOB|nr:hypothetical protein [Aliiroseovarius zhejiangensis]GHE87949.1 hypothetical protein GCM10016455_04940 [Aliiroseovarius zhejiangensis]
MRKLHFPANGPRGEQRTGANRGRRLSRAVEIYQQLLSHMDERPIEARAATISAISDGLSRVDTALPVNLSRRNSPGLRAGL